MFDYKKSAKNNKSKLAIKDCPDWSDAFSLDAAGTHNVVNCQDSNKTNYLVWLVFFFSLNFKLKVWFYFNFISS